MNCALVKRHTHRVPSVEPVSSPPFSLPLFTPSLQTDMENSVVVSDYQVARVFLPNCGMQQQNFDFGLSQQMDRILKEERKYIVDICQVCAAAPSHAFQPFLYFLHAAQTTESVKLCGDPRSHAPQYLHIFLPPYISALGVYRMKCFCNLRLSL